MNRIQTLEYDDSPENPTIAICDGPVPKPEFIGIFKPSLLKKWAEHVIEFAGSETPVYLIMYKALPGCNARALMAKPDFTDDTNVSVAGFAMTDDEVKRYSNLKFMTMKEEKK